MSSKPPFIPPDCERQDCFANTSCKCGILTSNNFKRKRPFFKTDEQIEREQNRTDERTTYGR